MKSISVHPIQDGALVSSHANCFDLITFAASVLLGMLLFFDPNCSGVLSFFKEKKKTPRQILKRKHSGFDGWLVDPTGNK